MNECENDGRRSMSGAATVDAATVQDVVLSPKLAQVVCRGGASHHWRPACGGRDSASCRTLLPAAAHSTNCSPKSLFPAVAQVTLTFLYIVCLCQSTTILRVSTCCSSKTPAAAIQQQFLEPQCSFHSASSGKNQVMNRCLVLQGTLVPIMYTVCEEQGSQQAAPFPAHGPKAIKSQITTKSERLAHNSE